ncbi:hypothetical protein Neosp_008122 [[Neocosmospora] mangrovei]
MDSIEYAIQASDCLRDIAKKLCEDKSCLQFCAPLQAVLGGITEWLRTLPNSKESKSEANTLLYQLEGLCRSHDPPQHASSAEEFYPSLRGLMAGDGAVVTIIRTLASSDSCQPQRRTALICLESFLRRTPEKKLATSPSDADIRARAVTFKDHTTSQHQQVGLDPDHSFCTYISAQEEDGPLWAYFLVRGPSLYFERYEEPPKLWKLKRPSISLGQLLEEIRVSPSLLTEKMKEVLSWLLAKAVWQYYSSPWMREPWNKESVHFLFERRRTKEGQDLTGIFVNEPLLSVSIVPSPSGTDPSHQLAPAGKKPGRLFHPTPKILALGILLVEIQLGQPIERLHDIPEWSPYCPEGIPCRNTNFQICRDHIEKGGFFDNVSNPLEKLIRNCIQAKELFAPPHVRNEEGEAIELTADLSVAKEKHAQADGSPDFSGSPRDLIHKAGSPPSA